MAWKRRVCDSRLWLKTVLLKSLTQWVAKASEPPLPKM